MDTRGRDRRAIVTTAVDSDKEEEMQVADRKATDRVSKEVADRVKKVYRASVVALVLARVATAILAVHREIIEEMADRVVDSETRARAKALLQKLPERIWESGARMKRDAQAAWRRTEGLRRTISTRMKRH